MGRGNDAASNAAKQNAGEASGTFGTLSPFLTSEMVHPAGFDPTTMAGMNTGVQQSAGGATAGAVGQGALRAARTRNLGAPNMATEASVRNSGETLSKGLLGVQSQNAQLKEHQRQAGASGLENLFHTTTSAVPADVEANAKAEEQSWGWAKNIMGPLLSAAGGAAGGGAFGHL